MIQNNEVRVSSVRLASWGNLALAPSYTSYRVIEGGQQQRRVEAEARAKREREARMSICQESPRLRQQNAAYVRRAMLTLATAALVLALISLTWHFADSLVNQRVQHALQSVTYQTVVVHAGDTLWDIAQHHAVRGCSTQDLVDHIRSINHIQSAYIQAGTQLSVPCS